MGTNEKRTQAIGASRKVVVAVALAFAAAGPAMAGAGVKVFGDDKGDSISLFGIIDAGVLTQNNSTNANGTPGGGITQEASNGLRQSVWGIKGGSGDLGIGGNSTAFFNLESHFDTATGLLHGTGDVADQSTPLFRRQANVGLTGDWGTLILGRQYGPALLADLNTEPRYFKEQFSNLYAWAYGQLNTNGAAGAGTNRNTNNDVGIFFENAVQYRNTWGPVTLGVMYSFGGTNNGFSYNSAKAVGLEYKGPLIVSGSYQDMKDDVTGKTDVRHTSLGAAYPWNDFTFKALYMQAVNNDANTGNQIANVNSWGVGSDWRWNARNTATLAFYYNHDKDHSGDSTRDIVLSDDFAMNSWVTAYFQYAYVNAGSTATLLTSIVAAGVPQQNAKTSLLNIGLNFSF
jgi:hypothetical protein